MATPRDSTYTLRLVLVVLAVIILTPILMMTLAMPVLGMLGGMMGGFSPVWSVVMLVVWLGVLIGGGYLVYRGLVRSGLVHRDTAMEELRLAYARGDLTDEEFEERRDKLSND